MTIFYEADMGIFNVITTWKGTVLQAVTLEPMFWFILAIHGMFWGVDYAIRNHCLDNLYELSSGGVDDCKGEGQNLPELNWNAVAVANALFSFFLIFYQSQCYSRFYMLYGHCVGLGGGIMEWASLVKQHLPSDPDASWNCVRFMLASMNIEYYGLRDSGVDDDEWKIVMGRALLTAAEVEKIKAYSGFKPFLPVYWALGECRKHLLKTGATTQAHVLQMQLFEDKALKFRGHTSQIINQLNQPVPFPYFHVLNMLTVSSLVLVAFALVPQGHVTAAFTRARAPQPPRRPSRGVAAGDCRRFDHVELAEWSLASPPGARPSRRSPPHGGQIGMTFIVLSIYMVSVLGIRSVAASLSDPFGTDAVDFELVRARAPPP